MSKIEAKNVIEEKGQQVNNFPVFYSISVTANRGILTKNPDVVDHNDYEDAEKELIIKLIERNDSLSSMVKVGDLIENLLRLDCAPNIYVVAPSSTSKLVLEDINMVLGLTRRRLGIPMSVDAINRFDPEYYKRLRICLVAQRDKHPLIENSPIDFNRIMIRVNNSKVEYRHLTSHIIPIKRRRGICGDHGNTYYGYFYSNLGVRFTVIEFAWTEGIEKDIESIVKKYGDYEVNKTLILDDREVNPKQDSRYVLPVDDGEIARIKAIIGKDFILMSPRIRFVRAQPPPIEDGFLI